MLDALIKSDRIRFIMKRKIISTILALIGLGIVGYVTLSFLGFYNEQDAGVLIESDPTSKVYINNKEVGQTPYESNIKPGEVSIKIEPPQTDGVVLDDYETKVNLVPGVRTIIKRTFKANDEDSSGITVSFEKLGGEDSYVTVVSIPDNAQVVIDSKVYGYTPLRVKIPAGDHKLLISSDGYLEKTLPIKVYKGYKLTASVKLAGQAGGEDIVKKPEELKTLGFSVKIKDNDVGFLRVRSGASTGFPEIAQVKPGEIYEVIEDGEKGKWYKIRIGENEGWVASEFVTKLDTAN